MPILLVSITRSAVKIVASSMTVSARRSGRVRRSLGRAQHEAGPADLGQPLERGAERQAVLVMAHPDFRDHGGLRVRAAPEAARRSSPHRRRSAALRRTCRRRRTGAGGARRARPPSANSSRLAPLFAHSSAACDVSKQSPSPDSLQSMHACCRHRRARVRTSARRSTTGTAAGSRAAGPRRPCRAAATRRAAGRVAASRS